MRDFLAAARHAVQSPGRATISRALREGFRVLTIPYRAQSMPTWVGPAWTIYLLIAALQRGSDLLVSPDGRGEISAWVNVLGNTAYGYMLLTVAALCLTAALVHRVIVLVIAHGIGLGIYTMYGIALLQGALAVGQSGWRYGGGMLLIAVLHAGRLAALRDEVRSTRS